HSDLYGYGRLNALRAVETATPTNKDRIQVGRTFATAVPDQGDASVSLTVSENGVLADVEVSVEIEHTYIGDLILSLTSPGTNGRTITLQSREGGSANNLKRTYRASTQAEVAKLIGKQSGGQWTLKVQDKAARDTGTIRSFALNLTLAAPTPASPPPAPKTTRRSTKKKARA
ncbi:MAG: proprotein convertase P-domain-containing protein, partial [Pirellulaceae bacterium]|nr:proprotein convertase P-domain-containing protein [Pirellulaceae bacterium]